MGLFGNRTEPQKHPLKGQPSRQTTKTSVVGGVAKVRPTQKSKGKDQRKR